jgi:hypothetical protein
MAWLYDCASRVQCRVAVEWYLCQGGCSTVWPARNREEHGYRAYVARFKRRVQLGLAELEPPVRRIIGCRIPHSMRRFLGQLNLGQPAYPRPKGTGDQSMPEKRRQARSASRTLRKARVARSRLDCFKSNPDRDSCSPLTRGWNPQADSVRSSCAGLMQRQTQQVRTMRYQEIDPGRKDEWTT